MMIEMKGDKAYILVEHWRYLDPVKDAPRKLLNDPKFKKKPNIYYVYY